MERLLGALRTFYGPLASPPHELFAFFVWDVVSARVLPARRDVAWQALKRLPALTPDAMFRASKDDLIKALSAAGNAEGRLEHLKDGSGHFRRHRDLPDLVRGSLAGAVRALADVPHLSPAARLRALLVCGEHAIAPVDDAVARVIGRLQGFPPGPKARLRRLARRWLLAECRGDRGHLGEAMVWLAHHASSACAEHAPHCSVCPLASGCAHAQPRSPIPGPRVLVEGRDLAAQRLHVVPHLRGLVAALVAPFGQGHELQVILEVAQGRGEVVQVVGQQAAVAQFRQG